MHSVLYGFDCENFTQKIVQNYLEYLKCPDIDYSFCYDYPCIAPGGDVFCSVDDVNLEIVDIGSTTVSISFTHPTQPYVVQVIDEDADVVIYTANNPTSPINLTILSNDTDYIVRLTLYCAGGEVKETEIPFHTLPICVTITDFIGEAEVTP